MAAIGIRPTLCAQSTPFRPYALEVADEARNRAFGHNDPITGNRLSEEKQWRQNIIDLQRVMSIAHSLFLILEHNNEALLRVAVEIVCCKKAQRCVWWTEQWFADDAKREKFRGIVDHMLDNVLASQQFKVAMPDQDQGVDIKAYNDAMNKAERAEAMAQSFEQQKRETELMLRQAQMALVESNERTAAMEKTAEQLRMEVRRAQAQQPSQNKEDDVAAEVREMQKQIKLAQLQREKIELELVEFKEKLREGEYITKAEHAKVQQQAAAASKKLQKEQENMELAEKRLHDAEARAKEAEMRATAASEKAKLAASSTGVCSNEEVAKLRQALEQHAKRAEMLEKEAQGKQEEEDEKMKQENTELRLAIQEIESRCKAAEDRATQAENKLREAQSTSADNADHDKARREAECLLREEQAEKDRRLNFIEPEEHEKVVRRLNKAMDRVKDLESDNLKLAEEKEVLEKKNMRCLKMLHELKEQLKRVTDIAAKKGCGNMVKDILKESKVAETLESPEYTAFNRLYDDALRRQERQRQQNAARFGLVETAPTHKFFACRGSLPSTGTDADVENVRALERRGSALGTVANFGCGHDETGYVYGENSGEMSTGSDLGPRRRGGRGTASLKGGAAAEDDLLLRQHACGQPPPLGSRAFPRGFKEQQQPRSSFVQLPPTLKGEQRGNLLDPHLAVASVAGDFADDLCGWKLRPASSFAPRMLGQGAPVQYRLGGRPRAVTMNPEVSSSIGSDEGVLSRSLPQKRIPPPFGIQKPRNLSLAEICLDSAGARDSASFASGVAGGLPTLPTDVARRRGPEGATGGAGECGRLALSSSMPALRAPLEEELTSPGPSPGGKLAHIPVHDSLRRCSLVAKALKGTAPQERSMGALLRAKGRSLHTPVEMIPDSCLTVQGVNQGHSAPRSRSPESAPAHSAGQLANAAVRQLISVDQAVVPANASTHSSALRAALLSTRQLGAAAPEVVEPRGE